MSLCLICQSVANEYGQRQVLGKYQATYLRCPDCGFMWVSHPHWLEEAYSQAIAALDTGIVARNLWLRDASCALLGSSLRQVRKILDYGGGTGLYVRLMRDMGHDAWWADAYCDNLLACGYEASLEEKYDLVTAFELVEHLTDPLEALKKLVEIAPRILISTEVQPANMTAESLMQWHYLAPEAGQHISFFTRNSLEILAEKLGLKLSSNGRNLHLLAPERINEYWLRQLRKPEKAARWAWLGKRKALTHTDALAQLDRLRHRYGLLH